MPDRDRETVVASIEISISGNRMPPEAQADLFHVEVTDDLDQVGMFALSLNAGDPQTGEIKYVDADLFREGSEVKIKAGFHAPLAELIVGEITAIEPEYVERGPIHLTVRGYNRLYHLGFGRKTRSFKDVKDSDVAEQIASDWNLTPEVEATTVTHPYLLQNNQTDLEFLLERARRIRYEVRVEGKALFFRKPQEGRGKILTLTYGEELVGFSPRLSLFTQPSEVRVQGWDPKEKKAIQGHAGAGDVTTTMEGQATGADLAGQVVGEAPLVSVALGPGTPEEADLIAQGMMNQGAFELVTGEGRCLGQPSIQSGTVLELRGLGRRFSGLYYVTSVTHSLSGPKGFFTTFLVRRSAA